MISKVTDLFGNIDEEKYELFNKEINSSIEYNRKTDNLTCDFSWIPVVEEALPYLDNIIRNPKKFLQQEEDIVIVEKSKKVTIETIQHLSQHTNYIQDVDDENIIKPTKVLNIEKEDSWDLYENRFIYTLVKELSKFVQKYSDKTLEIPKVEINNTLNYYATSEYDKEYINLSINLTSVKNQEPSDFNLEEIKNKIKYINDVVRDYENSSFIKSLSQAVPVKSPIKKTNMILKDVNFQKALELWEYIKNTEIDISVKENSSIENLVTKKLKDKYDLCYFLGYIAMCNDNKDDETAKSLAEKLLTLLEEYIDITDYSEEKIVNFISEEIKEAITKKKERNEEIKNIYEKYVTSVNDYINCICDLI